MAKITIKQQKLYEILDDKNNHTWGGVQYWFPSEGYIPPGACGATTGANILSYLVRTRKGIEVKSNHQTKDGFLDFMKESYKYMYPRVAGLLADFFVIGINEFAKSLCMEMHADQLKVPICRSSRPDAQKTSAFIAESLTNDIPVAFLILSSGATPELDGWHWVTIIGLDEETHVVDFIDNGRLLQADISLWLNTSIMGGSFIRLVPDSVDSSSRANAQYS